jgi:hypothetical protein
MTLAPGAANVQQLLAGKASLTDVLDALLKARAAEVPIVTPERRPLPSVVPVSDEQRTTLRTIVNKIDALDLPTTARELSVAEQSQFKGTFEEVKKAKKVLDKAEDALKETFHNHFDVELGTPSDTVEQDAKGHYVTEGEIRVDGEPTVIRREVRGGGAAALTEADLASLEAAGHITHADYLAMTTPVRVLDEHAVMKLLNARPELLPVFGTVAKLTPAGTAIWPRNAK